MATATNAGCSTNVYTHIEWQMDPPLGGIECCELVDRPVIINLCKLMTELHPQPDLDLPRDWELTKPRNSDHSLLLFVYGFLQPITAADMKRIKHSTPRVLQVSYKPHTTRNSYTGALCVEVSTTKGEMHSKLDASGATDFAVRRRKQLKNEQQRTSSEPAIGPLPASAAAAPVSNKRSIDHDSFYTEMLPAATVKRTPTGQSSQAESGESLFSKILNFLVPD